MFYRPGIDDHGLPHNPFKAMISPRPIGWISSQDSQGRVNLAPYSFFNALADDPPMVMFSNTGTKPDQDRAKDSVANIRATGGFVANIVGYELRDAMNATSGGYDLDVDEFEVAGLEKAASTTVAPPRVAAAPASLECQLWRIIDLPGAENVMVIGQVTGIHIDDAVLVDGIFDVTRYRPLARLGYRDYTTVDTLFPLNRPGQT